MISPMYFRHLIAVLLVMGLFTPMVLCQSQVEYLPGFPGKLPFKLETGYIGVGESEETQLFYYFIESERSPQNDPLLLYLVGGPGCSSFSALVLGIGPLAFDYDNTNSSIPSLVLNPYSWTKLSNIIFLDQPVGTGFSYAKSPEAYNFNETSAAKLIYEFLKKWLIKHPNYQKNQLYIAGESFCGMIIPLIVDHIYNGIKAGSKPHFNMKVVIIIFILLRGYILGNPGADSFIDFNGRVPYAYRMGLLSKELYESAKENCNGNYLSVEPNNYLCKNDMDRVNECVEKINSFHILEPWCDLVNGKRVSLLHQVPPDDEINVRRFLQSSTPKSWCRVLTSKQPMNYLFLYKWANIKSVQKALHIREGTITEWVRCNTTLKSSYTKNVNSTLNFHKKFLDQTDGRALIYSGDHDMYVPHSATEEWISSLNMQTKSDWRPWFVDGQITGYTNAYFNGDSELTYVTVKGAGHTASEYKPLECFSMFDKWLNRNPI